jgi:transposase
MEHDQPAQPIQDLDRWIQTNPDVREFKRAIAVKLSIQGWLYRGIAEILNVSKSFISKWRRRFEENGVAGLRLSYQGSQGFLTPEQKQEVLVWLQQREAWDLSELECYLIEQYDVVFRSPTSYYNLLKEAKISWQKAQAKSARQDLEKIQERIQEIRDVLEAKKEDIQAGKYAVYAIDEVHLLEKDLISKLWGDRKERLTIALENEKNRQTYYGALNVLEPELYLAAFPRGNGEHTVQFLKQLMTNIPTDKKILIFWDGAGYHKGKEVKKFLAEVNQEKPEEQWRITCYFLPPYAPQENPIEAVWLQLKNLLRKCYRFGKSFYIIKRLFQMFADYKLFNFPNMEKHDIFSCII